MQGKEREADEEGEGGEALQVQWVFDWCWTGLTVRPGISLM